MATGEASLFFKMFWESDQVCENLDCQKNLELFEAQWHHIAGKGAHPELRLEPNNIAILCVPCHLKAHSEGNSALNLPEKYEEYING